MFDHDVNMRNLEDHSLQDEPQDLDEEQDQEEGEQADSQGHAPTNPLDLSNPRLADFVRRVSPACRWDPPPDQVELEELHFPPLPHQVQLGRRTSPLIAGRGTVNLSFAHPSYYAEAARWWLNQLRWVSAASSLARPATETTVTYLECAIDC